ncbi:MAG: thioredoxin [Spirochaeta sp.]
MAIDVTKDNFETEVLNSKVPVLVDFWAEWCMPCKMVEPVLDELSQEYAQQFKVAKVDVDSQPNVAAQYEVVSIPTIIVFRNGEEVDRRVGAAPKETLINLMKQYV